jgi:excisionase family DNA binding protein
VFSWAQRGVAEVLGIIVRSVYRYAEDGTIPCHRLGYRILFDPEEVAAQFRNGFHRKAGDEPREEPVELPMAVAVIRERNDGKIRYRLGAENLTVAELIDGLFDGTYKINARRVTALQ